MLKRSFDAADPQAPVRGRLLSPADRRARLLGQAQVRVLLDIGANTGQYARWIRRAGFGGIIISFEPMADPFAELNRYAASDPNWYCYRLALGENEGTSEINVSTDSVSSSLLTIHEKTIQMEPETALVGAEMVKTARLDSLWHELELNPGPRYMKIDVQGAELDVLRGAEDILPNIDFVEAELSLAVGYKGQPLFREVIDYLETLNFELISLEPIADDPSSGRMLDLDGIFSRCGRRHV